MGAAKPIKVAEIKRRFSEVLGEVRFRGERFVIMRREQPMAAVVGLDDLHRLESQGGGLQDPSGQGLLSTIGAWEEFGDLERVIEEIYRARDAAADRPIILPP